MVDADTVVANLVFSPAVSKYSVQSISRGHGRTTPERETMSVLSLRSSVLVKFSCAVNTVRSLFRVAAF